MYALLYAGEEDEDGNAKFTPEEALEAAEKANGRVKNDDSSSDMPDESETAEGETNEGEEAPVKKTSANMSSIYLLVGVVALIGVGAGGYFLMKKKKDNGTRNPEFDPDADYDDKDNELDLFDSNDEDE